MKKEITPSQALLKAQALCATKELCPYDIREKLKRWEVATCEHDTIIEQLLDQRFIDEERYANSFVHDKFRFDHWGRIKIRYALRMKQIPSYAIEAALAAIDEEQYSESLAQMLASKQRATRAKSPQDLHAKLYRFALSRGFEPAVIQPLLNNIACEE